jgi:hypothetical protein
MYDGAPTLQVRHASPPLRLLKAAGCPKINLQIRAGNAAVIAFYEHIGYAQDEAVSFGRRLIADE